MLYNQDIPRICTALAEWGACMVYLYLIKREKLRATPHKGNNKITVQSKVKAQ